MKKLSIIITGRNDNYLNNYIDQTGRALNYTLKSIYEKKLEKNIELVFIDWGSGKLISDEIFIENKYKKLISFYHVPLKISKKERDYKYRINTSKAHNLGIRLSKSEFCLLSHSDQIYPPYVLSNLISLINGKLTSKKKFIDSYFYIPRKYLSYDYFKNNPSNYMINRYFENLNFSLQEWKNASFVTGGGWGGILAKKKFFEINQGLNEGYYLSKKIGMISPDLDFHQKTSLEYNMIDASNFGIHTYRYFEPNKNDNRTKYLVNRLPPKLNNLQDNKAWGLKNINFKKKKLIRKNDNNSENFLQLGVNEKIDFKKHLKFIISNSSKLRIYDHYNEIVVIYFLVLYFKVFGYLEIFERKDSVFKVISSMYKGLEVYKSNLFNPNSKNEVNYRFNLLKSLNKSRIGLTKINYCTNLTDCMKIFNFTPKEELSVFANIIINKENQFFLINKIIELKNKFSFLLIKKEKEIDVKEIEKYFKVVLLNEDFSVYLNKKLLNKKTSLGINHIFEKKNKIKSIMKFFKIIYKIKQIYDK
jgi:hypothetical protein